MPRFAPLIKVTRAWRYNAEVILQGNDFDAALAHPRQLQIERTQCFIAAFDDPAVIAGQCTLGLQIREQVPDVHTIIVPVGRGGLISGLSVALKESGAQARSIRIIGMQAALRAGSLLFCPPASTLADGIAVRRGGDLTLPLVQRYVDEVVTVNETEIAHATLILLEDKKTVIEGAAATTLAALLNRPPGLHKQKVVLLLSGGNIDVNIIARVIENGLVQEGRVARLSRIVPDRTGTLALVSNIVAEQGANVLEITHTRGFSRAEIGESELTLTLETCGCSHIDTVYHALQKAGYRLSKE